MLETAEKEMHTNSRLTGKTIVCFANGYEAPPTSKHHIMHLLAKDNVVLWVNYHASRVPSANSADLFRVFRKLGQFFRGKQQVRPHLYVLTPLVVPLPASKTARRLNRRLLILQLQYALRRIRRGPVQIWSFTPDISYTLGQLGEEKVIYYCVDDHGHFSGYNREQVEADEANLCERSDLVITTSLALLEGKKHFNPHTVLVQHGVDFAHFRQAVDDTLPEPDELKKIPFPRLLFFGLIRDWVNLDLVAEVAQRRPEWHFIVIGDTQIDLSPYRRQTNMHFIGPKPYRELPGWCRHCSVGLIPFQVNDLTYAVNPIKLREYLAAGLPVVSTPMPEVQCYEQYVHIAAEAGEFETAIEKALACSTSQRKVLSDAMSHETWESKLESIASHLEMNVEEMPGAKHEAG